MTPRAPFDPRRLAGSALLAVSIFVGLTTARLVLDGRRHLAEARGLAGEDRRREAIAALEDAARAYVPGSPYPDRALDRLAIMAKAAEMRGDRALAASVWESIRRSILASRHVIQPNRRRLEEAEREIGRLASASGSGPPDDAATARPADPSPAASILLLLGLAAWISGAAAICLSPRSRGGSPRGRSGLTAAAWAACLAGLALWIAMSWLAA